MRRAHAEQPIPPVLTTARQAASALSLSEREVRRMVKDGRLRAVRVGRAVRIPYSELLRLAGDAA